LHLSKKASYGESERKRGSVVCGSERELEMDGWVGPKESTIGEAWGPRRRGASAPTDWA